MLIITATLFKLSLTNTVFKDFRRFPAFFHTYGTMFISCSTMLLSYVVFPSCERLLLSFEMFLTNGVSFLCYGAMLRSCTATECFAMEITYLAFSVTNNVMATFCFAIPSPVKVKMYLKTIAYQNAFCKLTA